MKTIVSLITPPLNAAVAVIRMSGDEAKTIAQEIFSRPIEKPNHVYYGNIIDGKEIVDQVLLTYFASPKSFTGEDVVEISTHGSMLIANQVIELIISKGARLAERGEFSSRAYYNNKIDLVQAEAILSTIEANTLEAKKLALYSLNGETSSLIKPLIDNLASLLSNIEVNIDYPEYLDIEEVTYSRIKKECLEMVNELDKLLSQSKKSQYFMHGINVCLVGLPNTGKSSLLNAFLNQEKAIVTNVPGTTRDIVEGNINLDGLPLHLLDTAGIRKADNVVEQIGISKSQESIKNADLVIMVLDATRQINEEEKEILNSIKDKNYILVYNKKDLIDKVDDDKIYISALNKDISPLKKKILSLFNLSSSDLTPSLCTSRQVGLLQKAKNSLLKAQEDALNNVPIDLVSVSIKESYDSLKEILGMNVNVDLSEEIFSRFCVGK